MAAFGCSRNCCVLEPSTVTFASLNVLCGSVVDKNRIGTDNRVSG